MSAILQAICRREDDAAVDEAQSESSDLDRGGVGLVGKPTVQART